MGHRRSTSATVARKGGRVEGDKLPAVEAPGALMTQMEYRLYREHLGFPGLA